MPDFLSRFFGKRQIEKASHQPSQKSSAPAHQTPVTEKNRREAEERIRIVTDYGAFIERNPGHGGAQIWDVKVLPHPKEEILDAICLEIVREQDVTRIEALKVCALFLADYQPDVGKRPISMLGVDLSVDAASMGLDDIKALASKIANNPDRGRFDMFRKTADEDSNRILAKLSAAELLGREMPEEKKREILG
jgi:hypothetical protein